MREYRASRKHAARLNDRLERRPKKSMKERPGKTLADYLGSQESQPNNDDDRNSSQEESKDVTNRRCDHEFLIGKQSDFAIKRPAFVGSITTEGRWVEIGRGGMSETERTSRCRKPSRDLARSLAFDEGRRKLR